MCEEGPSTWAKAAISTPGWRNTPARASHLSASLAFNIAKREAEGLGVDIARAREELVASTDFNYQFLAAKRLVAGMPVQFAVENHAELRTVFEVYATYALGTQRYNTFETH